MKHTETAADDLFPALSDHKNISVSEARKFWQDQQAQGKVDLIFKQVEKKLRLLWQKIKDGSATDKEYTNAFLLVSEDDLLSQISSDCNQNTSFQLQRDEEQLSERCEEEVTTPDPDINVTALPSTTQCVRFSEHTCVEECLSKVNPFFNRSGNPLRFPILCHFQRWHAKSCVLSRPLDVIYKAPCGKGLRNFDDVQSYLFKTKCYFLVLDYFSFNTFLQLGRNLVMGTVLTQEADISRDVELVPVSLCNEIDNTQPPSFTYRKSPWPRGYSVNNFTDLFVGCCDCTDGCLDVSTCTCLQLTARACNNNLSSAMQSIASGYTYKRLQAPIPTGLYECNVSCKCDRRMCQNRVVQHGLQVRLQVYKTNDRGWGVRCLDDLDKGTFVCIYAGRILIKSSDVDTQDTSPCAIKTDDNQSTSIFCTRKRHISLSDSEVINLPANPSSSQTPRNTQVTSGCSGHQPKFTCRNKLRRFQERNVEFSSVTRPKTKTSIIQKRRRQLMEKGEVTMQHSSDDEEFIVPVSLQKPLHKSRSGREGEDIERRDDAGYLSDNSTLSIQSSGSIIQLSTCKRKDALQLPQSEENICILDASKEGNVARFLNLFTKPVCATRVCRNSFKEIPLGVVFYEKPHKSWD
ncbi:histone-lysine N-methyltransferase SETDB2-like isoform 2-T2 [Mantella aurantiaca]